MALHNLKITVIDGGKAEGQGWGSNLNNTSDGEKKKNKWYKMLHYNQEIKGSIKKSIKPTEFLAAQSAVDLAAQTARAGINYNVSPVIDGLQQIWSGKSTVDNQGYPMRVSNGGDCADISEIKYRIADCFEIN